MHGPLPHCASDHVDQRHHGGAANACIDQVGTKDGEQPANAVARFYLVGPSRMKSGRCRRVFVRYPAKLG